MLSDIVHIYFIDYLINVLVIINVHNVKVMIIKIPTYDLFFFNVKMKVILKVFGFISLLNNNLIINIVKAVNILVWKIDKYVVHTNLYCIIHFSDHDIVLFNDLSVVDRLNLHLDFIYLNYFVIVQIFNYIEVLITIYTKINTVIENIKEMIIEAIL